MREKAYHKLLIWQRAHQFAIEIYKITKNFPKEETYGLVSQIRRAALSVVANIVEGHSRNSKKEFKQFLYISKSSLVEVEYFLEFSNDIGYLSSSDFDRLENFRSELAFLIYKFMNSFK